MKTDRTSKAYASGLKDGLAWDLDGYLSMEEVRRDAHGWDEVTINAMTINEFCEWVGIQPSDWGDDTWYQACYNYNRGCYDGATAPQSERTGLPPYNEEV